MTKKQSDRPLMVAVAVYARHIAYAIRREAKRSRGTDDRSG